MDVVYPSQAIQTVIHMIILITTALAVFIAIFFVKNRPTYPSTLRQLEDRVSAIERKLGINWSRLGWSNFFQNIIPISGIILALVPTIVPVMFAPILDYSISNPSRQPNTQIYTSDITITNIGIFSANNVTVSVIADTVPISSIYSEPYLPNNTNSYNSDTLNQNGRAIFTIDKLLPHSSWKLHMTMNATEVIGSENVKLVVYVQSEETIGYHGVLFVILAYLTSGITLTYLSLYIFIDKVSNGWYVGVWGPGIVCIVLCAIFLAAHNNSISIP